MIDVRMPAVRLVNVDGTGDAVERDVLGDDIRDESCWMAERAS